MKISTFLSYAGGFRNAAAEVAEFERAGLDMVWVAEAYGLDGPSLMGYIAALTERVEIGSAILPIYTRTPALIAMTAAGIDTLSDGRFHLGLGSSGPQVIEGWHGVPFDAPIGRTREIIDVCRQVWAREAPLVHDGTYYHMPLPAGQGTGLGKALKIIAHPVRSKIPVWVAALGEKNVAMTAEVADGWIPMLFIPEKARDVWGASLDAGLAKRDPSLGAAADHHRGHPGHRRGRRGHRAPPTGSVDGCALCRWDGGQGEELLQRRGQAVRLRGRGRGHPGALPEREEGRGRGAGPRRVAGGDVPVRSRGLRGRADRCLPRGRASPTCR